MGVCTTSCQSSEACDFDCQITCQNGESDCQTYCEFEYQDGCGACKSRCQDLCQYNCVIQCEFDCQSSCEKDCQSACENSCQSSCERYCQSSCEQNCQDSCEDYCQSSCEHNCQDACQKNCTNLCEGSCQAAESCDFNCQVNCEQCEIDCQTYCEFEYQNGCESCQTNCQDLCEHNCVLQCEFDCQSSCEKGCESVCENSCQESCEKSNENGQGGGAEQEISNNNSFSTAQEIHEHYSTVEYHECYINKVGEEDYFKVKFDQNGKANFYILPQDSSLNLSLYLYDENKALISSKNEHGPGGHELILEIPVKLNRYYYMKVVHINGKPSDINKKYILRCKNYPNEKSLTNGISRLGGIDHIGDRDFYEVNITKPGCVEFIVKPSKEPLKLNLDLIDSDKDTVISSKDNINDRNNPIRIVKNLNKGIYYLEVSDFGDNNVGELYYISYDYVDISVTGITISPSNVELNIGNSTKLNLNITPDNATNQKVVWSSSNNKIAIIEPTGIVHAKGKGICTITATTEDGNYSDSVTVTVKNNSSNQLEGIQLISDRQFPLIREIDHKLGCVDKGDEFTVTKVDSKVVYLDYPSGSNILNGKTDIQIIESIISMKNNLTPNWYNYFNSYNISQEYNDLYTRNYRGHLGFDITEIASDDIIAIYDGYIEDYGKKSANGKVIHIKHKIIKGMKKAVFYSFYAHLHKFSIKSSSVSKGDKIGIMGTGEGKFAKHLHLAVYIGSIGGGDTPGYKKVNGVREEFKQFDKYNPKIDQLINNNRLMHYAYRSSKETKDRIYFDYREVIRTDGQIIWDYAEANGLLKDVTEDDLKND